MAPHSSTLAWKIPWTEEPGGLQSMGSLGVGHDWATSLSLFTLTHWRRKWQPTSVFLPGESQGRGSLVGFCLWGCMELDTTEATWQQQQHKELLKAWVKTVGESERPLAVLDSVTPGTVQWVGAYPFSSGSSRGRDRIRVSCTAGGFFSSWATSSVQFSSILQSRPTFETSWTAVCQASLSITNSQSSLEFMSIELVMPSNHLILCLPLLLLASIFPSIRVFSNESALRISWPKYWSFSFSISPSNEYSGLISFRMNWFDLLAVQGTLKSLLQHHSSKASVLLSSALFLS